jgi:hypothetical protein
VGPAGLVGVVGEVVEQLAAAVQLTPPSQTWPRCTGISRLVDQPVTDDLVFWAK